jgi:D-alanyl-D-alanine carboxypeptidase
MPAQLTNTSLEAGMGFRIASITKTVVAVLRLVEDGRLEIDGAAVLHLPDAVRSLVRAGYPAADGITIRHLLQRTSGVHDFGTDDAHFGAQVVADPHKRWTALDQLDVAFRHSPYCEPGAEFHYSDTGYVLLGMVLEQVTGVPIETAVRSLAGAAQLGLSATWWEGKEPVPADEPGRHR